MNHIFMRFDESTNYMVSGSSEEEDVFRLMRPEDFCNLVIPFNSEGNTSVSDH